MKRKEPGDKSRALAMHDFQNWGGWIRTTDLLINSQALCQLSYTPIPAEAVSQFVEAVALAQRLPPGDAVRRWPTGQID